MYVHTCIKCTHVVWSTRPEGICSKCGSRTHSETTTERDKRLGIKANDIHSWEVKDQLKGVRREKEDNDKTA